MEDRENDTMNWYMIEKYEVLCTPFDCEHKYLIIEKDCARDLFGIKIDDLVEIGCKLYRVEAFDIFPVHNISDDHIRLSLAKDLKLQYTDRFDCAMKLLKNGYKEDREHNHAIAEQMLCDTLKSLHAKYVSGCTIFEELDA